MHPRTYVQCGLGCYLSGIITSVPFTTTVKPLLSGHLRQWNLYQADTFGTGALHALEDLEPLF